MARKKAEEKVVEEKVAEEKIVEEQPVQQTEEKKNEKSKIIIYIIIIALCLGICGAFLLGIFGKRLTNDELICQKMNNYLEQAEYEFTTYQQLVEDLDEQGFYLDNLSPSIENNNFIYNAETNQFVLVASITDEEAIMGEFASEKYNNWVVSHNASDLTSTKDYSHYLANDYADSKEEIEINASLDCGAVDPYKAITYTSTTTADQTAKKIIICYNKEVATLTVNGSDTIKEISLVRETEEDE